MLKIELVIPGIEELDALLEERKEMIPNILTTYSRMRNMCLAPEAKIIQPTAENKAVRISLGISGAEIAEELMKDYDRLGAALRENLCRMRRVCSDIEAKINQPTD